MVNNDILNKLNKGEHIAEIEEYVIHGLTVYKVTVYTCNHISRIFKKHYIDKYEIPFFFISKDLAQEFLENWDNFEIHTTTYWDNEYKSCYALRLANIQNKKIYYMVDYYKETRNKNCFDKKYQLEDNGIWSGIINDDGFYYTYSGSSFNYKNIFDFESVGINQNKSTLFKMTKIQ